MRQTPHVPRHQLNVSGDFVRRLGRKPLQAIAELVWNGLDADAVNVMVELERNDLDGLALVRVTDDGEGMSPERAGDQLVRLGGSWKRPGSTTTSGRVVHGSLGRGRFAVSSFAARATWVSTWHDVDEELWRTTVVIDAEELEKVELESRRVTTGVPGTMVTVISGSGSGGDQLLKADAGDELTALLALHLQRYPVLNVTYDGNRLDTASVIDTQRSYELPAAPGQGEPASLVITEWLRPFPRALVICDETGAALTSGDAGIQAPGFSFTAYLRWKGFRDHAHDVALPEADPVVDHLLDVARAQMRKHFQARISERRAAVLDAWREEGSYPYAEPARDVLGIAEQQMFDVVAVAAEPTLRQSDRSSRRLSLALIRSALRNNPEGLSEVLSQVLSLTTEQLIDLERLLKRTTLAAIVAAAKTISDRLDFIASLPTLLYDEGVADDVLEVAHLQRLIAEHTWIFGEAYTLMADDQALATVLKRHRAVLGREELDPAPVLLPDGRRGRVDVCLGRVMLDAYGRREHVVIELKRPSVVAGKRELDQIISYADAVTGDARFADDSVTWQFWLVVNDVDDYVRRRANQTGRKPGLVEEGEGYQVWVKRWSQVIGAAERRLAFVRDALAADVTTESGLDYLRDTYNKYLPGVLTESQKSVVLIPQETLPKGG